MNPIVFALRRPVTVMMLVLALGLGGIYSIFRMQKDIFPSLNQPILYVIHNYGGMDPEADRGLDHQPVRALLSVHQQRRARRVAIDPEHGDAQALLPAGHRHGRGDRPDRCLLQPRAGDHAGRGRCRRT